MLCICAYYSYFFIFAADDSLQAELTRAGEVYWDLPIIEQALLQG